MEETKIDKRSKAYKESIKADGTVIEPFTATILEVHEDTPLIKKLFDTGIPVSKAEFQSAINNSKNVPENYFSDKSDNASRKAEMRLSMGGSFLICFQYGKYFGTPTANVKYCNFK